MDVINRALKLERAIAKNPQIAAVHTALLEALTNERTRWDEYQRDNDEESEKRWQDAKALVITLSNEGGRLMTDYADVM